MRDACRGIGPETSSEARRQGCFRVTGFRLRVTIRTDRVATPTVDPTDQAILDLLEPERADRAKGPPPVGGHAAGCGTRDIATAIGLSPRATRVRLARLAARGMVRELGTGPHDPRRRYVAVR